MSLNIDNCSHRAAKFACEKWHYSGSIPTPPLMTYGVWENGKFIGAVIYGRGANKDIGSPYGLKQGECCELVRVALTAHIAPVTKIVSISMKMLKKQNPGIRAVISYADPNVGHEGVIYKAGNWAYLGKTSKSKMYIDKNGKKWHPRQVSERGSKKQYGEMRWCVKPSDCDVIECDGKHRFAYGLDKQMTEAFRVLSDTGDTASLQLAEGGSIPTSTLQYSEVTHGGA